MPKRSSTPPPPPPDQANPADEQASSPSVLAELPVKRYYRQRAHCNPWSDHTLDYPLRPDDMDWSRLYSLSASADPPGTVRFVDVGCGYGGLLFRLSTQYPQTLSLGLEIRLKVSDFVQEKIRALRLNHPGLYGNIACLRTNAMKFLPNFFHKGQLHKLFFLYPDPHFKRMKHKWRIISPTLLDVYAYVLAVRGRLYSATDVPELAEWIAQCLHKHPLFQCLYCIQFNPSADGQSLEVGLPSEHVIRVAGAGAAENTDSSPSSSTRHVVRDSSEFDEACREDPILGLFRDRATDESVKATREGRGSTVLVFERCAQPRASPSS